MFQFDASFRLVYRIAFPPISVCPVAMTSNGATGCNPFVILSPYSLGDADPALQSRHAALDFANQLLNTTSTGEAVTVTNGGTGPLVISQLAVDAGGFAVAPAGTTCVTTPPGLEPGKSCVIQVTFTPSALGPAAASLSIFDNAADSPQVVRLDGTGTRFLDPTTNPADQMRVENPLTSYNYGYVYAPPSANPGPCADHGASPVEPFGYALVRSGAGATVPGNVPGNVPVTIDGQVVEGHVASEDLSLVHDSQDYNFFVYPDAAYRNLLAVPGQFAEGDDYEHGRVEVEWERRNPQVANGPVAGLPQWAWPAAGDRVHVVGSWIWDCGHGDNGYRTEIHPPRLVVTYRNTALSPFMLGSGRRGSWYQEPGAAKPVWANQVDIFASSFGGNAIEREYTNQGIDLSNLYPHTARAGGSEDWWQPTNDRAYQFLVKAPPKPSPGATLTYWQCDHLAADCNGTYTPVPGAATLPLQIDVLPTNDGYLVTIPGPVGNGVPADQYWVVAQTLWVGWTSVPSDSPAVAWPTLRTYDVTIRSLVVYDADVHSPSIPGVKGTLRSIAPAWTIWSYVAGQSRSLLNGNGTNANGESQQVVQSGQAATIAPGQNTFRVTLVDGQTLHVELLGARNDAFASCDEAGIAAITLPGDQSAWPILPTAIHSQAQQELGQAVIGDCPVGLGCYSATIDVTPAVLGPMARGPTLASSVSRTGSASGAIDPAALILRDGDLPAGYTLDLTASGYVDNLGAVELGVGTADELNQFGRQNGYRAIYANTALARAANPDEWAQSNLAFVEGVSVFATADDARQFFDLRRARPLTGTTATPVPNLGDGAFQTSADQDTGDNATFTMTTVTILKGSAILELTGLSLAGANALSQTLTVAARAAAPRGGYRVYLPVVFNASGSP